MIIDFHVHVFPDKVAEKAIPELSERCSIHPFTDGTLADTVTKLNEVGIDDFVFLSIATNPRQQKNVNDFAIEISKTRKLVFGSVHPDSDNIQDELVRIKNSGLLGIKLHPVYQGFDINDKRAYPIYECCDALGLPICFHAGFDVGFTDNTSALPKASADLIRDFPNLKIVLAHLGGYISLGDVLTYLAGRGREVYFDTAAINWSIDPKLAEKIIHKHGTERILFGSDCPWENPRIAAEFIDRLHLSGLEKERIFSENTKKLLGIK
ncbi:MAG: amidohydrolase family protein [Clostridiales bacterium]|nr:amidohydrolase family protein [Clostridiales bacterium]